ncbi:MGDG synthase family glycosyltransferase [Amycolatopsis nalaikhensis]|uniref:Glycosyltransferase n=1 Tax=Amycolatopsis nalaikhensis TaxID=715472 RepID=A0ABY8XUR6_9PSEU|nr:glycosyltransferase [Amycolatopsis sp. 2-2]WIV59217.1 glycosyltransferase [Amycolatopsis sp. 2-2]
MSRIVIVSARFGAGHDRAAYELANRLSAHDVEVLDFLDLLPPALGSRLCRLYRRQLQTAPRSWEWTLRALDGGAAAGLTSRAATMACGRLRRALGDRTDLAVSTYPLATHALAHLRVRGALTAPLATYLTDPAVHRICVAGAADLHIAPNHLAQQQARSHGATAAVVAAPLVATAFRPAAPHERLEARRTFGLPPAGRLALVTAGSWGVGQVQRTAHDVARSGVATPVVACGSNTALRDRLRAEGLAHVFGWVDDMPGLMRAVDIVVQNAGGLTSSEALAAGLPVLTYRCLPGHGRANAAVLDRLGLARWVHDLADLPAALASSDRPPASAQPAEDPVPLLEKLLDLA